MISDLQWTKRVDITDLDSVYYHHYGDRYLKYRQLWNNAGPRYLPSYPIHIDFELIDSCNLRCKHCFRNKDIAKKLGITVNTGIKFPIDIFKAVISEGVKKNLYAINLGFSGECTLNDDLCEMAKYAAEQDILDIRLISNGTLLTKELIHDLLVSGLTIFSVSVDASNKSTYKAIKGKDGFDAVRQNIIYAYEKKQESNAHFPLIRASFYPAPENRSELDDFIHMFKSTVDFIDIQDFKDVLQVEKHAAKKYCSSPFQRLAIFANGDVAPCCSFYSKNLIVGNIHDSSINDIWTGERLNHLRTGLEKGIPHPVCCECLKGIG